MNKIIGIFLYSSVKIVFEYLYIIKVQPIYSYEGFELIKVNYKYFLSWIFFFISIRILYNVKNRVALVFQKIQLIISILPVLILYGLADKSNIYTITILICFFIQNCILSRIGKYSILIVDKYKIIKYILYLLIFITIISIFFYNGFHGLKAFDFDYLYREIRSKTNLPIILNYLLMWTRIIIIPYFIIINLAERKYLKSLFFIMLQILLYTGTGEKFNYLIILVIISMYIFGEKKNFDMYMCVGITFISIIALKNRLILSLLGERFIFGPALNKFLYYDFFSQYPKIYFSDGMLGKLYGLTYPYNGSSGQLIFASIFKERGFESNSITGYLGDSYAQLGLIGMILISIILGYIIKETIETTEGVANSVRISLLSIYSIILNDTGLFNIILSGGLWLLIFLLYSYPKKRKNNVISLNYKTKEFIKLLFLKIIIIALGGILSMVIGIVSSYYSFNLANKNYDKFVVKESKNKKFNKYIFRTIEKRENIMKVIISSGITGMILSSGIIIIYKIRGDKIKMKRGIRNVKRLS